MSTIETYSIDSADKERTLWRKVSGTWIGHVEKPSNIIRWFMPSWFTVSMGTGSLANCIGRIPYEIKAIYVVGCMIYFINILLFSTLSVILISQMFMYPEIFQYMRKHPKRILHYGAIPMAMGTIVSGTVNYGFHEISPVILYIDLVFWWISVAISILSAALLVYLVVSHQTRSIASVTGAWLLLVAPLAVCAADGGRMGQFLPDSQVLPTLIAGYFVTGAGAPLTCTILVLYLHRVTTHKLPPHDAILTAFIPLGPVAQIGVAAISQGNLALRMTPHNLSLSEQLDGMGTAFYQMGVFTGLLFWGYAVFWAMNAVFSVVYQRRTAGIPFNISWWALTFPIGVLAMLSIGLSEALEMRFFRIWFLVLTAILFVVWIFNVIGTMIGLFTGEIFTISEFESADNEEGCLGTV